MPEGLSLYVRKVSSRRHGTPKAFAKRCFDHGLKWIAIGGIWQEKRGKNKITSGRMNSTDTFHKYADALRARGLDVYVWGYPWRDEEERFADMMIGYSDEHVLLDPELGSNPTRSTKGIGKQLADQHARTLVKLFQERMLHTAAHTLGLSTFGRGWRIGWFPLLAFTEAMVKHFGGHAFIGGQTYTDDGVIDTSIAEMQRAIEAAGGEVIVQSNYVSGMNSYKGIEIVPNFGTYTWVSASGKRGARVRGAKAKSKTRDELRSHLYEFVNEQEPVDALIGWAENFMTDGLWGELARFADMLQRGACRLPATSIEVRLSTKKDPQ